jgi:hypothetical protein
MENGRVRIERGVPMEMSMVTTVFMSTAFLTPSAIA